MLQFERDYPLLVFGLIAAFLSYLGLTNNLMGSDTWYWASKITFTPLLYNFLIACFIGITALLFLNHKGENKLLVLAFFFTNFFIGSFLSAELMDMIPLTFAFVVVVYFKNHPYKFLNHKTIAVIIYVARSLFGPINGFDVSPQITLIITILLLPAVYLLFLNMKELEAIIVLSALTLNPTIQNVVSILPILLFAFYLDLTNKKLKYNKTLMLAMLFTLTFIVLIFYNSTIQGQQQALSNCNQITKICYTPLHSLYEPEYGHYLAYHGYMNDGAFGQCVCNGKECLDGLLVCGK